MENLGENISAGAWVALPQEEEDKAWALLFDRLHFPMGVKPGKEPEPSITYSIAEAFKNGVVTRDTLEEDLNRKTLAALRRCIPSDGRLYALDWQHQSYWFYAHRPFAAQDWDAWKVPVLPDGDFYIFLDERARFCLFGDCVNLTICVFGQILLDAFFHDQPLVFTQVVRVNGEAI